MKVTVTYMAQIKLAAGVSEEEVALEQPCSAAELVRRLAERHGAALYRLLLTDAGEMQPTILMFVNEVQVRGASGVVLGDGDEVAFLSPIAGG